LYLEHRLALFIYVMNEIVSSNAVVLEASSHCLMFVEYFVIRVRVRCPTSYFLINAFHNRLASLLIKDETDNMRQKYL